MSLRSRRSGARKSPRVPDPEDWFYRVAVRVHPYVMHVGLNRHAIEPGYWTLGDSPDEPFPARRRGPFKTLAAALRSLEREGFGPQRGARRHAEPRRASRRPTTPRRRRVGSSQSHVSRRPTGDKAFWFGELVEREGAISAHYWVGRIAPNERGVKPGLYLVEGFDGIVDRWWGPYASGSGVDRKLVQLGFYPTKRQLAHAKREAFAARFGEARPRVARRWVAYRRGVIASSSVSEQFLGDIMSPEDVARSLKMRIGDVIRAGGFTVLCIREGDTPPDRLAEVPA
jgi:hypothetical protein